MRRAAKSRSMRFFICSSARPKRARRPQGPSGRDGICERKTSTRPRRRKQWWRSGRLSSSGVNLAANVLRNSRSSLVVNGHNDIMVPTVNSFKLSQNIPNAQLIIYPDAGHGALFQVPELFVAHAEMFLDA